MKTIEDNIKDRLQETLGINESHPSFTFGSYSYKIFYLQKYKVYNQKSPFLNLYSGCTLYNGSRCPTYLLPFISTITNFKHLMINWTIFTHADPTSTDPVTRAASATNTINTKAQANFVKVKDPSIETIGAPRNLHNYLLDFGTTQHMTPCLQDLDDVLEIEN
jgi:hypothetical protein